jgi:hypothetical protein
MSNLVTQHVKLDGTPPTPATAATSMNAEVGAGKKLIYHNGSGGSVTLTIAVPGTLPQGIANPDKTYTIANNGDLWAPLYDFYADPSDGFAKITVTSATTSTAMVVQG